jgi:gliding-associated putative ABC transporter substrate-binding component GldG
MEIMNLNNKKSTIIFSIIVLIAVILINLIAKNVFKRFDLTDNKMYSLSSSSKSVVKKIDDIFTIKVYFSSDLPAQYANNKRYLQDILEEYTAYSSGNLRFEFYSPENDEKLSEDAQKYGIQPVQLQVIENDKVEIKKVHMGLVLLYEDKREVIPVIQTSTGLEYDITTKIKSMVESKKNTVGLVTINGESLNKNVTQFLNERYTTRPNLNLSNPIPENIDVLLFNGVSDSLTKDQEDNLRSFISQGGNILFAQNRISVDIQTQQAVPIVSNIFDILNSYGLTLKENLVLDQSCNQVNVQQQMGIFRMAVPMDYPFLPILKTFSKDEVTVNGLESMELIFTSEIKSDSVYSNNLVSFTPLLRTSNRSSSMSEFYNLNPDPKSNPVFSQLTEPSKVVGARSIIADKETGIESNLTLVADSQLLSDQGGGSSPNNITFIMNTIDFMMGDKELISLRSREVTDRPLLSDADGIGNEVRLTWKIINMILPALLVMVLGFIIRRKQNKKSQLLQAIYEK